LRTSLFATPLLFFLSLYSPFRWQLSLMSRRDCGFIETCCAGENEDEAELCRLLQLVLGCAVHCERQEEFIQAILQMEEDVQRGIMAAIQGLPGIDELAGGSLVPNADSLAVMAGRSPNQTTGTGFHNLMAQLEAANEEKKLLAKERQKLNLQVLSIAACPVM
jgi:hypothetical protein